MATLGKVLGFELANNKDGENLSLLLQVELSEGDDIQSAELFRHAGVDYNPPTNSMALVIPITPSLQIATNVDDGIESEAQPGEYEIYSSDNGSKKATIKLYTDQKIKLNGGGLGVARISDTTSSNITVDPTFFAFLQAIATALGLTAPTTLTTQIDSGSSTVEAPND